MAYKVFLSHTTSDSGWVKWIAENANSIGIEVYLFEHDPQPGTALADKVINAIRDSDALIVLLTVNSQHAPYVHQEIGVAKAANKLIVPLVQPGVEQRSLAMLAGLEYVLFDFSNPQEGLAKLLSYLQHLNLKKSQENNWAILLGIGFLAAIAWASKKWPAGAISARILPSHPGPPLPTATVPYSIIQLP